MGQVVLIQAGSTDYDEQQRIQGTLDVPLSGRGTEQARSVAAELQQAGLGQMAILYCGPGECCLRTAEEIEKSLHVPVRQLDQLQNLDQGLWQGLQVEEVRRKFPKVYKQWRDSPLTVRPPGGETVADAYQRVRNVLKPILKRHRKQTIGLVVPEPIASIVYCYLNRQNLSHVWNRNKMKRWWQLVEVPEEAIYAER